MNNFDDNTWVNYATGEVKHNVSSMTTFEEETNKREKKGNQQKGYKYYLENIEPLPKYLQEQYGYFVHTRYEALLKQINYDTATAFRFIFLSTYMRYDDGYIIWRGDKVKDNVLAMIFDVSKNTLTGIKNTLIDYELIMHDTEGYIYINTQYCYRGDISKNPTYKQECTRVFNDSIRDLYYKCKQAKDHKVVGKLILLLPYVNVYHNIICMNILEKNIEEIELPNTKQLEEILHATERNADKVTKQLLQLSVGDKPVLMIVRHKNCKMFVVNPRIYYGGNNMTYLLETEEYFKAKGGFSQ